MKIARYCPDLYFRSADRPTCAAVTARRTQGASPDRDVGPPRRSGWRLCAWPEPEGQESSRLARESLILLRVDRGCFRDGTRFKQALDDEPGGENLLAGCLQRRQPVPHLPALVPGLFDGPDIEIAAAVAQPIAKGMLPRQHQRPAWAQHPAQFTQRSDAVIDVFDRERAQR